MSTALPLFPLNTVVFPGGRLALRVFEQRYLEMIKQAIAGDTPFGICAILSSDPRSVAIARESARRKSSRQI